jgi:hypothetical protein
MPKVRIKTKELESILKTFSVFSAQSFKKTSAITMSIDNGLQMIMSNDYSHVFAFPQAEVLEGSKGSVYSFDSSTLMDLSIPGEVVDLSWKDINSPLTVQGGKFKTELRIAVKTPSFKDLPKTIENSVPVPLGFLGAVSTFLQVPFSYFKSKKDLLPIRIFERGGFLCACADDGFSVVDLASSIPAPPSYEIKVPYYIIQALFSKAKISNDKYVKIGSTGYNVSLTNEVISVFTSGLNDQSIDIEETLKKQKEWVTSCTFSPKLLSSAIKPLMSLVPAKDTTGAIIVAAFGGEKLGLSIRHPSLGNAQMDEVDGVKDLLNEKSINLVNINMHPKAFQDYTSLFGVEEGKIFANNNAVLYDGKLEVGGQNCRLRYIFPTVQL